MEKEPQKGPNEGKKEAKKEIMVGLRLTPDEVKKLDIHCQGQLSRAQVIRILIQDFLGKSEDRQRNFLVNRLFNLED